MYRKFFGLAEAPFNLTPDSRFLFLSRRHREALANLIYGIQERKGFITLTGEIGSGKTTLCRTLANELDPETTRLALILNSFLTEIELLQTINEDFGLPAASESKKELIAELNRFLLDENVAGHNVVLIIDEAQNLSIEVLEQIRMLSNIETETDKLIQILLIGQPELQAKLALPELEQLNQRISVRYHIAPLDEEDVAYYIRHRLFVAKVQIEIEFMPAALKLIYEHSGGIPRKINILCDRCLLAAYSKVTYTIDLPIVKEAIGELKGERAVIKKSPPAELPKSRVRFANLILLLPVVALVIAGGVILGISIAKSEYRAPRGGGVLKSTTPSKPPYLSPNKRSPRRRIAADAVSTGTMAAHSKLHRKMTIQKTPPPKTTPRYLYNWQYDKNYICRVNDRAFAYPASIITWLRLWNIEVELSDFKKYNKETIGNLDLTTNKKLGLKKFVVDGDLPAAIRYDLPMILTFKEPPEKLAPTVVLLRAEGMSLTIADPIRGLRALKRNIVSPCIDKCIILYLDRFGLSEMARGERSQRVEELQNFLRKRGYLKGKITGVFDSNTVRAICNFQRFHHIAPSGNLDKETVLILSTRMITMRPRLYSSGGED